MDKLDIEILSHLLNNCRKPDRQIGQEIGISGVSVKSRIKKMLEKKIIQDFVLKIEPPVLGYSVLYFVVTGKEIDEIINQIKLVGDPFFVVPCVGGVTVCSIVVKEDPAQKKEIAKKSGFSTKTVTRSLDKLQNDEAIQFTVIYNPKNMGEFIPFVILVRVKEDVKKMLPRLDKTFSGSFLQKPF